MSMTLHAAPRADQIPLTEHVETHQVLNQASPCSGYNAFTGDVVLREMVARYAPWSADNAAAVGAIAGDAQVQEAARLANEHGPQLRSHDRFGKKHRQP